METFYGLESVRQRPGMYLGPTDKSGLLRCIETLVGGALDEFDAGRCSSIHVTLHPDGSCSVWHDGQAISVEVEPDLKMPIVEAVLTKINYLPGGKRPGRFMRGVDARVINAVSERFTIQITRNNQSCRMSFSKGIPTEKLVDAPAPHALGSSTLMTFLPDPEIFQITTQFDYSDLLERLREIAVLFPGLEICLSDEREKPLVIKHLRYPDGIRDYLREVCREEWCLLAEPIYLCGEYPVRYLCGPNKYAIAAMRVEVAFQFTGNYRERIYSFCNACLTPEGGTHVKGFLSALVQTIRELAKAESREEQLIVSKADCLDRLVAVVKVEHPNPGFSGGGKYHLCTPEVEGIVYEVVSKELRKLFQQDPMIANQIAERTLRLARNRPGHIGEAPTH